MNENISTIKEHNKTPYLIFKINSGEIIQGNSMARAFYSVDNRKVTVYDVLFGLLKDLINNKMQTFFDNLITQKANGVKYKCSATIEASGEEEIASLEVELLQDCLVEPLKEDMILSKKSEFILLFNDNLNIYFGNDEFYTHLNSNVEKIHKENKNSFLNLMPKKTRKYFVEQRDVALIRKRFALVQFQFSDIKDFNSGLSELEKEKVIDSFVETGLNVLTPKSWTRIA